MEPKRPTAVTVVAVLNMVMGGLGLICSCLATLVTAVMANADQFPNQDQAQVLAQLAQLWEHLVAEVPGYVAVETTSLILGFVLSSMVIVAGIGLLSLQRWARTCSLICAVVTLIEQIALLGYTLILVNPAKLRFQPRGAIMDRNDLSEVVAGVVSVFSASIWIVYAVVLLIVLLLPKVAVAFAPSPEDDYQDVPQQLPDSDWRH
jgi:hypothetical protein